MRACIGYAVGKPSEEEKRKRRKRRRRRRRRKRRKRKRRRRKRRRRRRRREVACAILEEGFVKGHIMQNTRCLQPPPPHQVLQQRHHALPVHHAIHASQRGPGLQRHDDAVAVHGFRDVLSGDGHQFALLRRHVVLGGARDVAVHVAFESKGLKPGDHT